jgi:uncharacterized protein (TIGR02466 family)
MATILPLFAVPLFVSNIGTEYDTEFLKEPTLYERMYEDNGYYTLDKNILDNPKLESLKTAINREIRNFAGFLEMNVDFELYIVSSWAVKHQTSDWGSRHYHTNALISGVYYFDVHPDTGDIIFENEQNNLFGKTLKFGYHNMNIFNANEWAVTPENGMIIIFPSHLTHRIDTNKNQDNRYCIAFNVFVKGTLGRGSKLSQLELK